MEFSTLQDPRRRRVRPSIISCRCSAPDAPRLEALGEAAAQGQVRCLVAEFESVTDPRGACGVRYRVSSLLALVVCAMTAAGHDSITAAAQHPGASGSREISAAGYDYLRPPLST